MRRIAAIVIQDLRVFLATRSNLPGLLLTPAVMTVLIGLIGGGAFSGQTPPTRLDVIDLDRSVASGEFLVAIEAADSSLLLCPLRMTDDDACGLGAEPDLTRDRALERLRSGTSAAMLEIPVGFGEALPGQTPTSVSLRSAGGLGAGLAVDQAVQAALRQVNGAAVAIRIGVLAAERLTGEPAGPAFQDGLYRHSVNLWQQDPVAVALSLSGSEEDVGLAASLQRGLGQSVPGMGTMFVMMTVLGASAGLIEERRQWTLQRLAMMPISPGSLLAGKIAARFSLGVLQFLVIFAVGTAFGMDFGKDPIALVLVGMAYTLAVTALSFAVGGRLRSAAQAMGVSLLLSLTLCPLGGAWWPLEATPRFMQIAGHISPVAWAMRAFTALTNKGASLGDIWPQLIVLMAMALLAFAISIPRLRLQVE